MAKYSRHFLNFNLFDVREVVNLLSTLKGFSAMSEKSATLQHVFV